MVLVVAEREEGFLNSWERGVEFWELAGPSDAMLFEKGRRGEERRGEAGVGVRFRESGCLFVVGLFLARHVLQQLTEGAGLS